MKTRCGQLVFSDHNIAVTQKQYQQLWEHHHDEWWRGLFCGEGEDWRIQGQTLPFASLAMTLWYMHRFTGTDNGKSHWCGNTHILQYWQSSKIHLGRHLLPSRSNAQKWRPLPPREDFIQEAIREGKAEMVRQMTGSNNVTWFLLFVYGPGEQSMKPVRWPI